MSVKFDLPEAIEVQLRHDMTNLDEVAKEAALVELYRQEKLTHHQLATALGLGRLETEELLKRHNVTEDLVAADELAAQLATLRRLVNG
jgi:Uncharacterised protein family (UPF0175)